MGKKKIIPGESPPVKSILTKQDLDRIKEPIQKKETKEVEIKDIVYECSFAPMGDAVTTIKYKVGTKDNIRTIKMHNKKFKYPEGLSKDEDKALKKALKENGFTDITVIKAAQYDEQKKEYIYSAMHPDHSDHDPFNANISLPILDEDGRRIVDEEGKQIFKQVAVVNGLVKTEDRRIYQALIKAGFKSCFAQERRK